MDDEEEVNITTHHHTVTTDGQFLWYCSYLYIHNIIIVMMSSDASAYCVGA